MRHNCHLDIPFTNFLRNAPLNAMRCELMWGERESERRRRPPPATSCSLVAVSGKQTRLPSASPTALAPSTPQAPLWLKALVHLFSLLHMEKKNTRDTQARVCVMFQFVCCVLVCWTVWRHREMRLCEGSERSSICTFASLGVYFYLCEAVCVHLFTGPYLSTFQYKWI